MGARNRRHPHNGVHGGPDVVGHPGKEFRLSLVGVLRHPIGVFQRLLLEPLPLDRFRHVNAQAIVGRYPILAVLPVHIAERDGQVTDFPRPGHDPALHDAAPPRFLRLMHRRLGLLHILRMNIQALALQLFFKLLFRIADNRQEFRTIPEDCAFIARVEPGNASRKAPQHRRLLFFLLIQFVPVFGDIKNELDSGFPPVPQYLPIFQEIRFPQLLVIMFPLMKSRIFQVFVGTKRTRRISSVEYLIAKAFFSRKEFFPRKMEHIKACSVHIQQFIIVQIADINHIVIFFEYPVPFHISLPSGSLWIVQRIKNDNRKTELSAQEVLLQSFLANPDTEMP